MAKECTSVEKRRDLKDDFGYEWIWVRDVKISEESEECGWKRDVM